MFFGHEMISWLSVISYPKRASGIIVKYPVLIKCTQRLVLQVTASYDIPSLEVNTHRAARIDFRLNIFDVLHGSFHTHHLFLSLGK